MHQLSFLVCYLVLFGSTRECSGQAADPLGGHHLIKRQAQDGGSEARHYTSSPSRHFVSPDGAPYYEHQPPVSSSRGSSLGRQATSHVKIGGVQSGRPATSQVIVGEESSRTQAKSRINAGGSRSNATYPTADSGSRSRTYRYPFGREHVQYAGSESQGYAGQSDRSSSLRNGTDSHQVAIPRRDNPDNGFSNQRSSVLYQNDLSQAPSNQQLGNDAPSLQEQELRRRHDELRRKHEEERRKQMEERQRLIEDRKRQDEERRRLYYERLNQHKSRVSGSNQDIRPNVTRNHQSSLLNNRRQQSSNTAYPQQREVSPDPLSQQSTPRTATSYQDGQPQLPTHQQSSASNSSQQTGAASQQNQQSVYSSYQRPYSNQQPLYTTNNTDQQGSNYLHNQQTGGSTQQNQQPVYTPYQRSNSNQEPVYTPYQRSNSNQEPVYTPYQRSNSNQEPFYTPYQRSNSNQEPVYTPYQRSNSNQEPFYTPYQRSYSHQQPVYTTNNTGHQGSHNLPNQRQGFSQQPAQIDPRIPGLRSSSEQSGQSQRSQFGSNFGSSFSYEQQDNDWDCPETGIDLRINGLDCQQAVQQFGGYLCYTHEYTSRDCCNVCKPRKQPSRTGCEYGDHAELCTSIAPADCYDLRNRYSCCETCERLKRNNLPSGCEYGDMTIKCENVRQNPGLCYIPDNKRLCCETCNQIRNVTNPGCPWGDYNSNLCQLFDENTSNVRINCYSQQRRRLCCQSCERLKDWMPDDLPADCQYGDRPVIFTTSQFGRLNCSSLFSYFSVDECRTNEAVAVNCCHTCHRILQSRG